MIKTFDEYSNKYSSDFSNFSNKINIAINDGFDYPYFNKITNIFDLKESSPDLPIIMTDFFYEKTEAINESNKYMYNSIDIPPKSNLFESISDSNFCPKLVNNIREVKSLKFPIVARGGGFKDEYKTIGKLKSANKLYSQFIERPVPKSKFKVLSFKDSPISIVEWINKFPLDVDINSFNYIKECEEICKILNSKFNLDFYNVEIIESLDGKIYLKSIDKKLDLNPHQAKILYETAYEDFYKTRLPNWVKDKILEDSVIPYYKKKYLDSNLISSKNCMDYSKYN